MRLGWLQVHAAVQKYAKIEINVTHTHYTHLQCLSVCGNSISHPIQLNPNKLQCNALAAAALKLSTPKRKKNEKQKIEDVTKLTFANDTCALIAADSAVIVVAAAAAADNANKANRNRNSHYDCISQISLPACALIRPKAATAITKHVSADKTAEVRRLPLPLILLRHRLLLLRLVFMLLGCTCHTASAR